MRPILLFLLALLAACDSGPTTPAIPLAGTYALETIGGEPLPFDHSWTDTAGHRNLRILLAATLTIREDGTFLEVRSYQGETSVFQLTYEGAWAPEGDRYRLDGGHRYQAERVRREAAHLEAVHPDGLYRYRVTQ